MTSLTGSGIVADRECLRDILQATLKSRIVKSSGRDKTLSEVHNSVCSVVRDLTGSPFYVTTEFADRELLVAAVLSSSKDIKECISVNIDSPAVGVPIDVEVRLSA